MKGLNKISALILACLILVSTFVPISAAEVTYSDNIEKVDSKSELETLVESVIEDESAVDERTSETLITESETKVDEPEIESESSSKPEGKTNVVKEEKEVPKEKKQKKNIESSGANKYADCNLKCTVSNVYRNSNPNTEQSNVTAYYWTYNSDTQKTKYTWKNGSYYSGKYKKIVVEDGKVTATWECDDSSLENLNNDDIDSCTGTLTIALSSKDNMPEYYYGEKTGKKGKTTQVWAPWNAYRKSTKADGTTEWVATINHKMVKKIVIDETCQSVSANAFRGFNGKKVNQQQNGDIEYPFSLTLSKNTKTLKENCFDSSGVASGAINSKEYSIAWNSAKTIEAAAFNNCEGLITLNLKKYEHTLKDAKIKSGGTQVDVAQEQADGSGYYTDGVFSNCNHLEYINFNGVTTIPKKCVSNCDKLRGIDWGSVETVNSFAFSKTGNENETLIINGTKLKDFKKFAFRDHRYSIVSYESPSLITTGGNNKPGTRGTRLFEGADNMQTVYLSGTKLKTISAQTFKSCSNLSRVIFAQNVNIDKIEESAFRDCTNLIFGGIGSSVSNIATGETYGHNNITPFTLPSTIETIEENAFRNCANLEGITWDNIAQVKLKTIKCGTFYNDNKLKLFVLPNSVTAIEGTYDSNQKSDTDNNKYGAFSADSSHNASDLHLVIFNNYTQTGTTGELTNEGTKLRFIGDKAFFRPTGGVILCDAILGEATSDSLFAFKNLQYIGNRAFSISNPNSATNNTVKSNLKGIILSETPLIVASRAFMGTQITDLYFPWNPEADWSKIDSLAWNYENYRIENKSGNSVTLPTSVIGSSAPFISSDIAGYTYEYDFINGNIEKRNRILPYNNIINTLVDGKKVYGSLSRMINSSSSNSSTDNDGLIFKWKNYFNSIKMYTSMYNSWGGNPQYEWGPDPSKSKEKPAQGSTVPEKSYGFNNNNSYNYTKDGKNYAFKNYLKSAVKWLTYGVEAEETITFGYKNETKYNFVFVVDNSPSMDKATKVKEKNERDTKYATELNVPMENAFNASKTMNAYSQIYNLSEKLLQGSNNMSVSVISFRGNDNNALAASSKVLSSNPMTTKAEVYEALFENADGYKDNNDGVTNYSSGLSRAYKWINEKGLNSGNKKAVVIFISDGQPTYKDNAKDKAIGAANENDSDSANVKWLKAQVNGYDWASAIKGSGSSYTVHSYTNSNSSNQNTENVSGLNVPIYGILIGSQTTAIENICGEKNFASGTNMKTLGKKISKFIEIETSVNHEISIPFDNNFVLQSSNNTETSDVSYVFNVKLTFADTNIGTIEGECKFTKNGDTEKYDWTDEASEQLKKYCRVSYDSEKNVIHWSMGNNNNDYITEPYIISELTFKLDYKGYEYKANTNNGKSECVQNNVIYAAVNDICSQTSKFHSDAISKYGLNQSDYVGNLQNGNENNTNKYAVVVATTSANNTYTAVNRTPPLYLPLNTNSITLNKYLSKKDGKTEITTNERLGGAKFELYRGKRDANGEVKLEKKIQMLSNGNTYTCSVNEGIYRITTSVAEKTTIKDLPDGMYYLVEVEYPTSSDYKVSASSLNNTVSVKELNGEGRVSAKEIVLSGNQQSVNVNYYNRKIEANYNSITSIKMHAHGGTGENQYSYLSGAKIGIYDSYEDAMARRNCIDEVETEKNGEYKFSTKELYAPILFSGVDSNSDIIQNHLTTNWEKGKINNSGVAESDTSGYYYRSLGENSSLINMSGKTAVNINVINTSYYYQLFWYKSNSTFLSKTRMTNVINTVSKPSEAAYLRIVILKTSAPGVDINAVKRSYSPFGKRYYIIENKAPNGVQLVNIVRSFLYMYPHDITISSNDRIAYIYDVDYRTINIHVNSSDGVRQGFKVRITGDGSERTYPGSSSRPAFTAIKTTDENGDISIKVPAYYAYVTENGTGQDTYVPIEYTVEEIGYNNGNIPDRYLWQEYYQTRGDAGDSNFDSTIQASSIVVEKNGIWHGDGQWGGYGGSDTQPFRSEVYIYNPSLKLTVRNFDGTDRATPLTSSYKINPQSPKIPYNITGTIPVAEETIVDGNSLDWESTSNTTEQSEYYDIEKMSSVRFDITGIGYTYKLFTYNSSYTRQGSPSGITIIDGNMNQIPEGAKYMRIVRTVTGNTNEEDVEDNLSITVYDGGYVSFDEWLGSNQFTVEQTKVQSGYNLNGDVVNATSVPMNIAHDKYGNKYYSTVITFYNSRQMDLPFVGDIGASIYFLTGSVFLLTSLLFFFIARKRKNTNSQSS